MTHLSLWFIFWPIYHYDLPLSLKVSLSDIDKETLALLWLLFAWCIFFLSFCFQPICVFESRVFLLKTAHSWVWLFDPVWQSLSFEVFSLCTFNDIPDMTGFMPIILLFVFYLSYVSFVLLYWVFDIKYVFINHFNLSVDFFLRFKSYFISDCYEGLQYAS